MSEVQPALLALPPPRTVPTVGLRETLRSASALPVEPVAAVKRSLDSTFSRGVDPIESDKSSDTGAGSGFQLPLRVNTAQDWIQARFFGDQSGPFVAQQIGQSVRLITPTLEPNAEVAAYAATQQRAEAAASGRKPLLDLHT